ncbi:MAG: class F sortase [Chloroflexi bacterium]|nr:class F sortase [Chloroflexota bacterium]
MRVCRPQLFAILCFATLAGASAACGNPEDGQRALAEDSPTAAIATPMSATDATTTAEPQADETRPPATATPAPLATAAPSTTPALATATAAGIEATATVPPPCRKISFSPGESFAPGDLAARGRGDPVRKPFLGVSLVIRKLGISAPFIVRVVGPNGVMPPSDSATDVSWYDFSQFPDLGGTPGTDHGNVIVAGNYDYSGVPQAVFFRLSELVPGDLMQINTSDGRTLAYEVEFNKTTAVDGIDWSELVASTPEESLTLITAAAAMNQGRRVVWGRALDTGCSR